MAWRAVVRGLVGRNSMGRIEKALLIILIMVVAAGGASCFGDPRSSQQHLVQRGMRGGAGKEDSGMGSRGGGGGGGGGGGWRKQRGGNGYRGNDGDGDGDDDVHNRGVNFWEENLDGIKEGKTLDEIATVGFMDEKERQQKDREGAKKAKEKREEEQGQEAEEALRISGLKRRGRPTTTSPQGKMNRDLRGHEGRGRGGRGAAARRGARVGVAPRIWDTVTQEVNHAAKRAADERREEARKKVMQEVVDKRGTTREQLMKQKQAAMRPRIDPTDPFAPTRKWADREELDALMPDKGDERRKIGIVKSLGNVTDEDVMDEIQQESPWYCPHCDISVTNDMAYLNHINGKRHLRTLGYSSRVREETSEEIRATLDDCVANLRAEREERERAAAGRGGELVSLSSDVQVCELDEGEDSGDSSASLEPSSGPELNPEGFGRRALRGFRSSSGSSRGDSA